MQYYDFCWYLRDCACIKIDKIFVSDGFFSGFYARKCCVIDDDDDDVIFLIKWYLIIFQVGCSSRQAALITSLGFITLEMDNQRRYLSWSLTLYVMLFVWCWHFVCAYCLHFLIYIVEPNIKCNFNFSNTLFNVSVNRKIKHSAMKKNTKQY